MDSTTDPLGQTGTHDSSMTSLTSGRLSKLLEYIEQAERSARKPQSSIPASGEFAAWSHELIGLPGVRFDLQQDGDHIWMRVDRLSESAPPELSDPVLEKWVEQTSSVGHPPKLLDVVEDADGQSRRFSDLPESVRAAAQDGFATYLAHWERWAEAEQPRRVTMALYAKLFAVRQAMEGESSSIPKDLVWGVGIGLWRSEGRVVRHPLITRLVEISLDERTLSIEIRPRSVEPRIELDAFAEAGAAATNAVLDSATAFFASQDMLLSPFSRSTFEPVLRAAVTHLDHNGTYHPDQLSPADRDRSFEFEPPAPSDALTVLDSWVIFSRRRDANFLIEDLHRLRRTLSSEDVSRTAAARLVSEPSDVVQHIPSLRFRGISDGRSLAGDEVRELYFPKPYNAEQVSIIDRLERSDAVVVQGPPGTGKTHTIANVICHYLAQGKRVLVTSRGEPALAVVQEQLPEGIAPLTVSLLTSEREGLKQFEHAIQRIASEVSRIDPAQLESEIGALEDTIDRSQASLALIDREIGEWASRHLTPVTFAGKQVMPESLARYVIENEAQFKWMDDPLKWEGGSEPPLSDEEVKLLLAQRRAAGRWLCYAQQPLPEKSLLPDVETIGQMHDDLREIHQISLRIKNGTLARILPGLDRKQSIERMDAMIVDIDVALGLVRELSRSENGWAETIRGLYRKHRDRPDPMILALDAALTEMRRIVRQRAEFVGRPVEVPQVSDLARFNEAIEKLSSGQQAFGLLSFGAGKTREELAAVRVAGNEPAGPSDWRHVATYLAHRRSLREVITRWNSLSDELGLPKITSEPAVKLLPEYLDAISIARRLALEIEDRLPSDIEELFLDLPDRSALFAGEEGLLALRETIQSHLSNERFGWAKVIVEQIQGSLLDCQGPLVERLNVFLLYELGSDTRTRQEVQKIWAEAIASFESVEKARKHYLAIDAIAAKVEAAGAPLWAARMRRNPVLDERKADPVVPPNWREAWMARRAAEYLEKIDGRRELREKQTQRADLEGQLRASYGRLVELKTWLSVYLASTPRIRSALNRYMNAIRMIGKGTGVRAARYRREAREAMADAHLAVPCWVMPHWRVSESLPSDIGSFDLVIVDEASQSDLWALPSLVRGRKLMIVGDDRQVSPDAIGIEESLIQELGRKHLANQPFASEMTPEKSIYDLARVAFSDNHVMLREHFRSVQPIIEFSNRNFYDGEIRALRVPRPSERIDPPLVDVYVKSGTRDVGSKVNKPEARAIVDEIKAIVSDPSLAGRSIGVISLLGNDQAQLIDRMIRQEIDAAEIRGRRIECGDARTFQGKERHIMMLSMVVDPRTVVAATRREFEQRFNVAATRARDRMYLFRSVQMADLNPNDLRAKLLSHFDQPMSDGSGRIESLRDLCESGFERKMFDALASRNYRVRPQVVVGAYRIDLVVEGANDRRLAIECDGDRFHGPEKWADDMRRQRVLERAGWTFWRCFASTFSLHRDECLADLIETLTRQGVEPIGNDEAVVFPVVQKRVVMPLADEHHGALHDQGGHDAGISAPKPDALGENMAQIPSPTALDVRSIEIEGNDSIVTAADIPKKAA
jgi:very-short-patch-repair endonuclease